MTIVKDMLRDTEVAVCSFMMLRPRFLHPNVASASNTTASTQISGTGIVPSTTTQPMSSSIVPVFEFYSGLPRRPSPFLQNTVTRFEKYLGECKQWIEELEQLLLSDTDDRSSNSDMSLLHSLPKVMSNVHDYFFHVAAKERVASLYEDNPSIAKKDLDHDAVALILGRDNRGRVKGMGDGVSKTSIKYSDPYKKTLQKEHESQVILQAQVENLEKRLEVESRDLRREMEAMFASLSQANTQMRPSTERGSSSRGSQSSQSLAAHLDQTITYTRGPSLCKLQHMIKKNIIAYGRLQSMELPEAGFYRIVLNEIVDRNVDLFDGERKLGDVILDVFHWPIIRTILY